MKRQKDCTAAGGALPPPKTELVVVPVDHDHPLLQLKRALPWQAIEAVMVAAWRQAGKNLDGSRGRPWPVSLYAPLLVLMLIKRLDSREMEGYLAENAVARVFVAQQACPRAQLRDHASIARALAALGAEGVEQLNGLIVKRAAELGFADPTVLSGDTTAQELPIGYPHEAGILRGIAQRCLRALVSLKERGVAKTEAALEEAKAVLREVKGYHLLAKDKAEKDERLRRVMAQSEALMAQTGAVVATLGTEGGRVVQAACDKLRTMGQLTQTLIPQIASWLATGRVAAGKILHPGITQAKAIVRNKAGKKVEFGLPYLINRLAGGYLFGRLLERVPDEKKMPLESLKNYREMFGAQATPELFVYDRGGHSRATIETLKQQGIKEVGIVPKGQAAWCVAEDVQQRVKQERSRTEGSIGTLKSEKYGFNKPKERLWEMLRAAGQGSLLASNLNTLMRDIVAQEKRARQAQVQAAA